MINRDIKQHNFYIANSSRNDYGELVYPSSPSGTIEMAIYQTQQGTVDSVEYSNAQFIGLTKSTVTDQTLIENGSQLLKVLYTVPSKRFNQVFMARI